LEHSIKKHCPNVTIKMIKLQTPKVHTYKRCFESNTVKIDKWLEVLKGTKEDVIFMDADMMVLRDVTDLFNDKNHDVFYSKRDRKHLPMNGGFVGIRNNEAGIDFLEKWVKANRILYEDIVKNHGKTLHSKWRSRYGGMNQAAFGYMLSEMKLKARLKPIPCYEWNACVEHWAKINASTRVVHIKGGLRRAVMSNRPAAVMLPKMRKAVEIWRQYAADIGLKTPDENCIIGLVVPRQRSVPPQRRKKERIVFRQSRYLRRYL